MKKGENLFSAVFLTPAFIFFTIFILFPICLSFYYTLVEWSGIGDKTFIWFDNYKELVKDKEYWQVAKNTFTLVLLAIVIQNPVGIVLAYLISRIKFGYKFFRSSIFLPVVISAATTGLMFSLLLNNDLGIFNNVLKSIGLGFLQQNWLTDPKVVLYSVALPQVWQYLGIHFIIYLAAIQSIPKEIFESAHIDGANGFQVLRRIVIPLMWDVVQIAIVLNVTGSLKAFDMSWIMTWGGPGSASSYISVLMFRYAFKGFNFSYGTTVAMTILIYSLLFTVIFKKFFSKEAIEY